MSSTTGGLLRLLIVDDDQVDRMAVIRALERIDVRVEVTEAEDVSTARAALAGSVFDLVVVDHNLPDGEAPDVLAAARERPEPVPVIVLTGQGDEDLAVELMKEGARDYIPKAHLSPARLGHSIRHVVEVSRAEGETRRARNAQRFLVEVSAELARSLDYDATVERIPALAVPAMADYALLHLLGPGERVRLAAAAHRDSDAEERLRTYRALEHPAGRGSPVFQALETGEPVLVEEVDEAWMERSALDDGHVALMRENGTRSVILAPLRARGRILGSLAVAYTASGRLYDAQDVAVIQNLAGRAALALDNARLYQEVRNEVSLVDTLRRLGETITAELDIESVVEEVTDRATELAGADFGAYYHREGDGEGPLQLYCVTGVPESTLEGVQPAFCEEVVRRDGGWETWGDDGGSARPDLGSYLLAPVRSEDRIIGGMFFGHRDPGAFDERDERIVRGVASWAAVAIQNARLYEGAQQAARARDDTLAVVSHDLRNPLNVIATSAALILEIPLPEEKKRAQLETIRRTTERMNRLIQDLLDVTSIEAGKLNLQPAPVSARELVDEACESMAALVEEEGLTLVREHPDDEARVEVDRERIAQVFSNLIGNAIRYTPEGGSITVGARGGAGEVSFWVEDTGAGIPAEQHPHLFDRFWRAKHQGATGAGLGLPIARGIVEMHGGSIVVESEVDRGTRFTFTIPVNSREPAVRPPVG